MFREISKLKPEEVRVKGVSGIEHCIRVIRDENGVFLYAELNEPKIEDIVGVLAIAVDTNLKPYFTIRNGSIPKEWISEIRKLGGKISYH